MDITHILEGLNDAQREAVTAPVNSTLVLAGAGSGKTRVLVHRIAWLIQVEKISPWGIIAVTFTNKAANEMKNRIEALLGEPIRGMWVGTFHGLAHRFLRAHHNDANLPKAFQILDSDDQHRLIKRLTREMNLDESKWQPRQTQWFINKQKDGGLRADKIDHEGDPYKRQMVSLYKEYEGICRRSGAVDFAELILLTYEIIRDRKDIQEHYQKRFESILVDEFQDTNNIQYSWLRVLCGASNNLFVVGDDDQSIYGWRGARVENIQEFQKHYDTTKIIRLEQNYRSTNNILCGANSVIANNASRLGKNLWTEDGDGEPIRVYGAYNEIDEARFVINRISSELENGSSRSEIAILYRTSAQSRLFEEALIQQEIPYRVYGGLKFFERAEVKDALAYLRLTNNHNDDSSFERSVNRPTRGVGAKTIEQIRLTAKESNCSLWQAGKKLLSSRTFTQRAANALNIFYSIIEEAEIEIKDLELPQQVDEVITRSQLREHFIKSKDGKGQDRLENLEELVNATRQFTYLDDQGVTSDLDAFLAHAALESGDQQADYSEDSIQLMTLHSAKGLEFNTVFICGMEEGLFPHSMSADDPVRLEEERRLCYVGMTRAMKLLFISHSESRRLHGSDTYPFPSRFLREIPTNLIEEIRPKPKTSKPYVSPSGTLRDAQEITGYQLGQRVSHPKFGEGIVLNAEGQGAGARIQINFETVGSKWLVVAYAKLSTL